MSELELGYGFLDGRHLERLLEHRKHSNLHLLAGLLDRVEDCGAAVADQLHGAPAKSDLLRVSIDCTAPAP